MKRLLGLAVVVMLTTLMSCGGGGNGGVSIRTVQLQFRPGAPSSHTDLASGITVSLTSNALPQAQPVRLIFSENWDSAPRSGAIKKLTSVIVESVDDLAGDSLSMTAPVGNRNSLDLRFVADDVIGWYEAGKVINGSVVELTHQFRSRAAKNRAGNRRQYGLILAPYSADFSETTIDLIKLAGVGHDSRIESGGACILWHGMNNTAKDMEIMAKYLVDNHYFTAAYAVVYPWGDKIAKNGQLISDMLRDRISAGVKVTVFGHSMGGLLSSYAVERAGIHDLTNAVVLIGTPRQGASAAMLTKMCGAQANQNLNDPNDTADHWAGLCDLNTPSVQDMRKDSAFMDELNGAPLHHSLSMPYFLFAGIINDWGGGVTLPICPVDCDGLIHKDNLFGYQYEGRSTLGRVVRAEVPRNHAELITSGDSLSRIGEALKRMTILGPIITITVPNDRRATDRGWDLQIKVANPLIGLDLDTEYLPMGSFLRDGEWEATQWYSDKTVYGESYPDTPSGWERRIASKSSVTIPPHMYFKSGSYDEASYNERAKTLVVSCSGLIKSTNQAFSVTESFKLLDQDGNGPTGPPRHSRSSSQKGAVVFGPKK